MTLRRIAQRSIAALALVALGVAALADAPASAESPHAAPSARAWSTALTVQPMSGSALGDDRLVPVAVKALHAWNHYRTTGDTSSLQQFRTLRDQVATEAARREGVDGGRMRAAWAAADQAHQLVLMTAFTQLGTPYRHLGRTPGQQFDCSGFTGWVYEQSGVALERSSRLQIRQVPRVNRASAQAGDLVYYPGHISIYLGIDNLIVHSPQTGRSVEVSHLSKRHIRQAKFGNPLAGQAVLARMPSTVDWAVGIA